MSLEWNGDESIDGHDPAMSHVHCLKQPPLHNNVALVNRPPPPWCPYFLEHQMEAERC